MSLKGEILDITKNTINELKKEGLQPDILLAGRGFVEQAGEALNVLNLSTYIVEELEYDAVVADSRYLGQIRRASKRISIEPLLVEENMWEELEEL